MAFVSLIWKNLLRRRFRTALTLIALSTAIAAVVALLGIAQGFQDSFADVYRSHSVDVVVSRQGAADRLSSSIDEVLVGQIDDVDGVEKSAAVLLETLSLEEEGVYGIPAMGMAEGSWLLDDFELRGSAPAADEVLLGIHLADRLELGPGDSVSLFDDPYVVSGVFTSRSTWENGSMVLPLSLLQVLTGREGQVTYSNVVLSEFESAVRGATADADLKVDTVIDADAVIEKIRNLDSKLLPLVTEEFVETDTRMQIASAMAWMTSMIAIVIGAIGTLNTMMTSVMERTDEIGILRAIGWSRRRIVGMIFGEACLLAMFAGALGGAMAAGLTWGLSQSPAVKGILEASLGGEVIGRGIAIGLSIGILGAWLPAWRAARMQPVDAIRTTG